MDAEPLAIEPLRLPFELELDLPGSKSEANRAIVVAALAEGRTVIEHATPCDDVRHLVDGLGTLGFSLRWLDRDAGRLEVQGGLPEGPARGGEIFCGNAGTTLRFLVSVAALVDGDWAVTGDAHMRARPILPLVDAWRSLGLEITATDGCPPVRLRGGAREGGAVRLDASLSSQYLTSLLLVAPRLETGLRVTLSGRLASPGYVELTRAVLARFGVVVEFDGACARIEGRTGTACGSYAVEGDWSAAGPFLVLAALTGGRFRGLNLRADSRQSDRLLPATIARLLEAGDLEIDVEGTPDQLMNLAVLAALRSGRTRFSGAANLRHKECDRLAVTVRELERAGVAAREEEDGITVTGGGRPTACVFDPEDDHRMAMAFALIGKLAPGFAVRTPACVAKSYPRFFSDLAAVNRRARPLVVAGMRAAGKTTLGEELARALGLEFRDSDAIFEEDEGATIAEAVERSGWDAFRAREEQIIRQALAPNRVLAIGGGALESMATRGLVKERALAVWLDEDVRVLEARLAGSSGGRPSLTGRDPVAELAEVARRRRPLFAEVGTIRVGPRLTTAAQVEFVTRELARRSAGEVL